MRKRMLLAAMISVLGYGQLKAQEREVVVQPQEEEGQTQPPAVRHELYAGYGVLSIPVLLEAISNIFGGGAISNRGYGPVQVGYTYLLSEKWSVGLLNSYTSFTSRYTRSGELNYRHHYYCVMPRVDGYWVRKEKILLYSGVALGAVIFRGFDGESGETNQNIFPAAHLNVMGLRVGKELGFFADFGYGYNGLINTGVNVRF